VLIAVADPGPADFPVIRPGVFIDILMGGGWHAIRQRLALNSHDKAGRKAGEWAHLEGTKKE
jgi:hypothetical protein